jgi:hypothetical protein
MSIFQHSGTKKAHQPFGLWLKTHHPALQRVRVEWLHHTLCALFGTFSVTTEMDMKDQHALITLLLRD